MNTPGTLARCNEALRFIETIPNLVTRNLVNMAFAHLVKEAHVQKHRPQGDVDMLFIVTSLAHFFDEHDVLGRTLQGEKVGAWFDDDDGKAGQPTKPSRLMELPG
jgi:hypothetical protein